jgi:branched-chain amino acid aminotransferase
MSKGIDSSVNTSRDAGAGDGFLIWRDGTFVPWRDATLHVMSHVVHYGSSVFEGVRCYETPRGPALFRLKEHIQRLAGSARVYRLPLPHTEEQLRRACIETVAVNHLTRCYLRPIAMRTGEELGLLAAAAPVETFVIPKVWDRYLGAQALEDGVDVSISSWRRPAPDTFPTLAKAGGNYLNAQLAKMQAHQDGYVEGIMLDTSGLLAEGSGENLFLVLDGALYTAPLAAGILKGITRDSVMRIAAELGYTIIEQALPRESVHLAEEMFFTGTAAEITPIRSVDRIPVGTGKRGPITEAIQTMFMNIAKGARRDEYNWLTYVE